MRAYGDFFVFHLYNKSVAVFRAHFEFVKNMIHFFKIS